MKIICIGRNYIDHAKELNNPIPSEPLVFMKPSSALLIKNRPLYYPEFTKDLHYEVELVVKISKNGRNISSEFAHKYYDEIGLGIDFTARDIQSKCKAKGHPWEKAKAFDYSALISEFVPLKKKNIQDLQFHLNINGEKVQHGYTKDMIFSVDVLLEHLSKYFKLQIGDLIYTGTPAGVGPLKIGDQLEGYLEDEKMFSCTVK